MHASTARLAIVDMLRGFAVLMMFAYHGCFDLANFGYLHQNLYDDPRWIAWRTLILSTFLLLAGASLTLAWRAHQPWPSFRRRLLQIAGCALLVSLGSYLLFPASWIWFGVLHHLALASLLALPFIRRARLALTCGFVLVVVGIFRQTVQFEAQPWQFIGLMHFKPRTEDYVPLLPWLGVVLIGVWAGHQLAERRWLQLLRGYRANGRAGGALAWAGRHSLLLYMLHQPLFIGLLSAWAARR
jgi:uncharacterized membrane protein